MGLIIKAVRDGFRRCGIPHYQAGTWHPDGTFTEAQLNELRKEPQLVLIEGVEEPEGLSDEREEAGTTAGGEPLAPAAPQAAPASAVAPAKAAVAKPKAKPTASSTRSEG